MSSGGSVSDSDDGPSDGDALDIERGAASQKPAWHTLDKDLPKFVDGVELEEVRREDGDEHDGRRYHAYYVRCPLADSGHCHKYGCGKHRGFSPALTRRYGQLETIGYLGAWVRHASTFSDRRSHMRYTPSVSDFRSYLEDNGLI